MAEEKKYHDFCNHRCLEELEEEQFKMNIRLKKLDYTNKNLACMAACVLGYFAAKIAMKITADLLLPPIRTT